MVETILDELNIKNRATRFVKPPKDVVSYAVWFDSVTRRGADSLNCISEHTYTIELYSYRPDPDTEKLIEDKLDELAIQFEKDDREYLDSEQLYEVIYTFTVITKEE